MALPGIKTIIKDRFYSLSRTDIPVGPLVVAIGSRTTATGTGGVDDYDPYFATNEEVVKDAFGEGSQLHRAYVELLVGGAQRVALVALPTGTVDADLDLDGDTDPFQKAFDAAETVHPDIIVPWGRGGHPLEWEIPATPENDEPFGFYADNSTGTDSFAYRIAKACADISARSHPVMAILGVKPYVGSGADAKETISAANIATHVTLPNLLSHDDAQMGEYGPYVSIVAAELKPVKYRSEWGYANGAAVYAGAMAQLDSWSATTGKIIYNNAALRYNPTRTQQESLINKSVVPVALNFNRTPTWIEGLTFAKTGSDYARLSTMRIVFDAINVVRQVSQRFVGEGASLSARNALETAISSGLRGMQQLGALLASDFVVTYVPVENKALVDLVLTPAFELRTIEVSVSVQL